MSYTIPVINLSVKVFKLAKEKYSIKCPYAMTPQYITIHNTWNDASAENEVSYMQRNGNEVSFHAAVDDKQVVEGLPLNRNSWSCGDKANGDGNRKGISVEICYSKSNPNGLYYKAEENAVWYVAYLMNKFNLSIDRLRRHKDWSGKNCPHRIIEDGSWEGFKGRVDWCMKELKGLNSTKPSATMDYKIGDYGKFVVTTDDLNVRKARDPKSTIVTTLPKGTQVKVEYILGVYNSKEKPLWGSVYTSKGNGFINLNYTKPVQ